MPSREARFGPAPIRSRSPLLASLRARLALVTAAAAVLWLAVYWALS